MRTASDFARLLAAAKVLGRTGDTAGAKALIKAARELLPASEVGLCGKCSKRLQRDTEALRLAEAGLRDGAVDGKAERAAAA